MVLLGLAYYLMKLPIAKLLALALYDNQNHEPILLINYIINKNARQAKIYLHLTLENHSTQKNVKRQYKSRKVGWVEERNPTFKY
jgi:hypothetical protein